MPIYEYECTKCGKKMEALVFSKADENKLKCFHCGSGELKRIVSMCFSFGGRDISNSGSCGSGGKVGFS